MNEEKLNKEGLKKVWLKIWTLLKLLVGDVDVSGKGDLQTQINNMGRKVEDFFRNVSDGKSLLADAITGKGVPTEASDTFATMAEKISNIKEADDSIDEESLNYRTGYNAGVNATKKGTAGTGDVLVGKTFTNATTVEEAGAMANKGATTVDAGAVTQDDTYTYMNIPAAGYYDENSKLRSANSNLQRVIDLGAGTSFDVTKYSGYQNFTVDNFIVEPISIDSTKYNGRGGFPAGGVTITQYCRCAQTKKYDNGILTAYYTVTGGFRWTYDDSLGDYNLPQTGQMSVHAYLIP